MSDFKIRILLLISLVIFFGSNSVSLHAAASESERPVLNSDPNVLDELNPFDPKTETLLEEFDRDYQADADKVPFIESLSPQFRATACFRSSCQVYAYVRRSDQKLYLFVDGNPVGEWAVSTGAPGHDTPDFDRHPNGRIYDQYTSSKFPGGNYQGLGNMPYAVFIEGGFAIHGTAKSNWPKLGHKASHGCIRVHPDNAFTFNRLVRQHGISATWIQVSE